MATETGDRRDMAIHEAAHAVLLLAHGAPVRLLYLEDAGGLCEPAQPWSEIDPVVRILALEAGALAAALLGGATGEAAHVSAGDAAVGLAALRTLDADGDPRVRRRLRDQAEQLVALHRAAIEFLAGELARRGVLDAADLGKLCREAKELSAFSRVYPTPPPPRPAAAPRAGRASRLSTTERRRIARRCERALGAGQLVEEEGGLRWRMQSRGLQLVPTGH